MVIHRIILDSGFVHPLSYPIQKYIGVGRHNGDLCVYALVDENQKQRVYKFYTLRTNEGIPSNLSNSFDHIGSILDDFPIHVFVEKPFEY